MVHLSLSLPHKWLRRCSLLPLHLPQLQQANRKPPLTSIHCGVLLFYWITTDTSILDKSLELGKRGSTAVTAILIDFQKLVVANVGDSRAVVCKNGVAKQLSVDYEPRKERTYIEDRGGFVSNFPGN
ncbi:probable protein phosphatase 2C 39 [Camellia sinensis]|uniref:probable protein phosphatase 2C 39 n=1 Tax=Camellia sinensis TaxID=4442 RepID=UPI0010355B7E|nr:probable protein phosphatase 2C 39 [Camellia sinensis]